MSTQTTLSQIFANVNAAKDAEIANERSFVGEVVAHADGSNQRNIGYYMNAMALRDLTALKVFRDFLLNHTNLSIALATASTKVALNGDVMKKGADGYETADTYQEWFAGKVREANIAGVTVDRNSTLYVVRGGFAKRPKAAEGKVLTASSQKELEARQAAWDKRKSTFEKFIANEPVEFEFENTNWKEGDDEESKVITKVVEGYDQSIIAFMSKLAKIRRQVAKELKEGTDEIGQAAKKLANAKAAAQKALAALAALDKEAAKEVISVVTQQVLELGNGQFAIYGKTEDGRTMIPVIAEMTEEGHYVMIENSAE